MKKIYENEWSEAKGNLNQETEIITYKFYY